MNFDMDFEQVKKLKTFLDEHDTTCPFYDDGTKPESPSGAIGGRLTYCFTPTGLGDALVVKCACGEEINLTDYASW